MASITPTVGRVVWFRTWNGKGYDPELAAHVAKVNDNGTINVMLIMGNGSTRPITDVPLIQEGDPKPRDSFCEWMPYQRGQAAKTEQAESVAEAARRGYNDKGADRMEYPSQENYRGG